MAPAGATSQRCLVSTSSCFALASAQPLAQARFSIPNSSFLSCSSIASTSFLTPLSIHLHPFKTSSSSSSHPARRLARKPFSPPTPDNNNKPHEDPGHHHRPSSSFVTTITMVDMAERIEIQLRRSFKIERIERLLKAWYRMRTGDHYENEWRPGCLQYAACYMEGLGAFPIHHPHHHPWSRKIAKNYRTFAAELYAAVAYLEQRKKRKRLQGSVWSKAPKHFIPAYGKEWQVLMLKDNEWNPAFKKLFPLTHRIIRKSRMAPKDIMFARQPPRSRIKPHTDNCNFILTAHIPISIPSGDCYFQIGDQRLRWEMGKIHIFDTTFMHESVNNTDEYRDIMIIRFWHPVLEKFEIEALTHIFYMLQNADELKQRERPSYWAIEEAAFRGIVPPKNVHNPDEPYPRIGQRPKLKRGERTHIKRTQWKNAFHFWRL